MSTAPDIVWAWCRHCMDRTDHRRDSGKLVCIPCERRQPAPQTEPAREKQDEEGG